MKKLLKSFLFAALGIFALSSCEDVPAPYTIPGTEGNESGETTPAGIEVTCAEAIALVNQLTDGSSSTETYAITGYITEVPFSVSNGQQTFWMADTKDGGQAFEAYYAKLPEGVSAFTVGTKVKITGKLTKFINKSGQVIPEINKPDVEILEDEGGTNPPTPTGENILANGDFEAWTEGQPDNWKSASSASNATLSQSEDARGGSYAVAIAAPNTTGNKRMAYKELTLKAGTYKFSIFAKSTTEDKSQTQVGYVTVNNGTADSKGYKYGGYVSLNNTEWTEASTTFTLSAQTTVCLVVMNPKTTEYATAQTILVDDATLITSDGGIAEGDDTPDTPDTPTESTFDQDFTKGIGSWIISNVELGGLTYVWQQSAQYGMKGSAFSGSNKAAEAWLISPEFNVGEKTSISFNNCMNYLKTGTLSEHIALMVSTDYSEGLPSTATWTTLDFTPQPDGKSWTWIESKADISAYANQTIRIAFKYVSTEAVAPTWEIKSVKAE